MDSLELNKTDLLPVRSIIYYVVLGSLGFKVVGVLFWC